MKKIIFLLIVAMMASCKQSKDPVRIIFDTDMLTDPEDVNALYLLHAFADAGEAEIIACVVNGHEANRASGAAIDVVNTYYNRPNIPIGTYKGGYPDKKSTFTFLLRDSFPHDVPDDDKLPDALKVYRQSLATQPDHSVVIVSIGFLQNLKDLILSQPDSISNMNGKELIKAKVKELTIMGGKYPEGKEYNFYYGGVGPVTKDVLEQWPEEVPVILSGYEIGERIISGKPYKEKLPNGPLRLALENAYDAINRGRESWDETAVIYGVRGLMYNGKEYWKTQSQGSVFVNDSDGSNQWLPSPDKNQSYLIESMNPDSLAILMESIILNSIYNKTKK